MVGRSERVESKAQIARNRLFVVKIFQGESLEFYCGQTKAFDDIKSWHTEATVGYGHGLGGATNVVSTGCSGTREKCF